MFDLRFFKQILREDYFHFLDLCLKRKKFGWFLYGVSLPLIRFVIFLHMLYGVMLFGFDLFLIITAIVIIIISNIGILHLALCGEDIFKN